MRYCSLTWVCPGAGHSTKGALCGQARSGCAQEARKSCSPRPSSSLPCATRPPDLGPSVCAFGAGRQPGLCQPSQEAKPPASAEPTEREGGARPRIPRRSGKASLRLQARGLTGRPPQGRPLSLAWPGLSCRGTFDTHGSTGLLGNPRQLNPKSTDFDATRVTPTPEINVGTSVTTIYL